MDAPIASFTAPPAALAASSSPDLASVTAPASTPKPAPVEALKTASTAPGDDDDDDDDGLASLLRRAFPSRSSAAYPYLSHRRLGDAIVQANAEGARYSVTWTGADGAVRAEEEVFVKRVDARKYGRKPRADLRRTLLYARTERRFYGEVLPLLEGRGFAGSAPRCHVAECDLTGLVGDDELATDASRSAGAGARLDLRGGGGSLVLRSLGPDDYFQDSPLPPRHASRCLAALARMHAAAWEDAHVLSVAAGRLNEYGGSYHLRIRNPRELAGMRESWARFADRFRRFDPDLFGRAGIRELGRRVLELAEYVSVELSPSPDGPHATLVHGDYKAMNVFLPHSAEKDAVIIDYASAGVGLGMSDVAMHVAHAVRPEDLRDGGEGRLVDGYLEALRRARGEPASEARPYPREAAMRHYRLAAVDYFRFVLGRFYGSATPESFEKKRESKNTVLVNRDVGAALAFIERVDGYLSEFEEERRKRQGHGGT